MACGSLVLVQVVEKGLLRLKYEDMITKHPELQAGGIYFKNPEQFVLDKLAYFQCHKCKEPYYGGLVECLAAGANYEFDPTELVCGGCTPHAALSECRKHGEYCVRAVLLLRGIMIATLHASVFFAQAKISLNGNVASAAA